MPKKLSTLCCCIIALLGCGSGKVCDLSAAFGLTITLKDAQDAPICGATVTATDASYSETLTEIQCRYVGAAERPGTYTITATKAGYATAMLTGVQVTLADGACHVTPATETLTLQVNQ